METKYKCPKCKRLLYTRQSWKCRFCGAEIPEELLLIKEEKEKYEKQKKQDHKEVDDYKKSTGDGSPGGLCEITKKKMPCATVTLDSALNRSQIMYRYDLKNGLDRASHFLTLKKTVE